MSDRKAEILAVASRIAVEQGMQAITVRKVAAAAGIGASTLRHYFPTQQSLYSAVALESTKQLLLPLRIAEADLDPALRLVECLMQYLPAVDGEVAQLQALVQLIDAGFGAEPNEAVRSLYQALDQRSVEVIEGWLAVLEAEGRLAADRTQVAGLLGALVDGLAIHLLTNPAELKLADARSHLLAVVRGVVLKPS